jgi:hypothetical protein
MKGAEVHGAPDDLQHHRKVRSSHRGQSRAAAAGSLWTYLALGQLVPADTRRRRRKLTWRPRISLHAKARTDAVEQGANHVGRQQKAQDQLQQLGGQRLGPVPDLTGTPCARRAHARRVSACAYVVGVCTAAAYLLLLAVGALATPPTSAALSLARRRRPAAAPGPLPPMPAPVVCQSPPATSHGLQPATTVDVCF